MLKLHEKGIPNADTVAGGL